MSDAANSDSISESVTRSIDGQLLTKYDGSSPELSAEKYFSADSLNSDKVYSVPSDEEDYVDEFHDTFEYEEHIATDINPMASCMTVNTANESLIAKPPILENQPLNSGSFINAKTSEIEKDRDIKITQSIPSQWRNLKYDFSWEENLTFINNMSRVTPRITSGVKNLPTDYVEKEMPGIKSSLLPGVDSFSIHFYTFIQESIWKELKNISLRIGYDYWDNFHSSYGSFCDIHSVDIDQEVFIILFAKLQIPIHLKISKQFYFHYKYYLQQEKDSKFEGLYYSTFTDLYNRRLYLDLSLTSQLKDRIYTQYDLLILPNQEAHGLFAKIKFTVKITKQIVLHQSLAERIYLSLVIFLPNFFDMGKSLVTCDTIDVFFGKICFYVKEFVENTSYSGSVNMWIYNPIFDNNLNTYNISQDWLGYFLFPLLKQTNESLNIYIYVSIALLIINEYSLQYDSSLLNGFIKILLDCVDRGVSVAPFHIYFSNSNTLKNVHNFFVDYIMKKYSEHFLNLFPFYQTMFYIYNDYTRFHIECNYCHPNHWGIPQNCLYPNSFKRSEFKKVLNLHSKQPMYPLLPYTILFFSLSKDYVDLIELLNIPYSYFLKLFLYFNHLDHKNISNTQIDMESRLLTITQITSALDQEKNEIPVSEFDLVFNLTLNLLQECNKNVKKFPPQNYIISLFNLIATSVRIFYHYHHDLSYLDENHIIFKEKNRLIDYTLIFCKQDHRCPIGLNKLEEELHRWNMIISLDFPVEYEWIQPIFNYLCERLSPLPTDVLINMTCKIFPDDQYESSLKNSLIDEVSVRISQSTDQQMGSILQIICGVKLKSDSASRIFSNILLTQRAKFSLNHLTSWKSWKFFFTLYFSDRSHLFTQDAISFFESTVLFQFRNILDRILTFSILESELQCYQQNKDAFHTLLNISLNKLTEPSYSLEVIRRNFSICSMCMNFFNEQLKYLKIFEHFPTLVPFSGFTAKDIPIKNICLKDGGTFTITINTDFNDLVHSQPFIQVTQSGPILLESSIFNMIMERHSLHFHMQKAEYNKFIENIWNPTIEEVDSLLKQISDFSIPLKLIIELFDKETKEDILTELQILARGMHKLGYIHDINRAVDLIPKFLTHISLSQTAQIINSIRIGYGLIGNFDLIRSIEDTKGKYETMSLRDISPEMLGVNKILTVLTDQHLDLLIQFNHAQEFVLWIKSNLPEIKDVKSFVDLASTTCGENPTDLDRITCLLTVCTELQPIIYMDSNISLESFVSKLENLSGVLEINQNLPKMLHDVSDNLSLWKDIINARCSVEEKTLLIVEKIVKHGYFIIQISNEFPKLSKMVKLKMVENKKGTEIKIYNYDQINEYLSKFMLLFREFDSKNSEYNLVLFPEMFEKISIFSKLLQNLYKLDQSDFASFYLEINLNQGSLLDMKIAEAQSKYAKINETISKYRLDEYFLSYYTNSQLVYLKNVLNSIILNPELVNEEQVFHLLSLVNPDISKQLIFNSIKLLIDLLTDTESSNLHIVDGSIIDETSTELIEENYKLAKIIESKYDCTESHALAAIRQLIFKKENISEKKIVMWCNTHPESGLSDEEDTNTNIDDSTQSNVPESFNYKDVSHFTFDTFAQIGKLLNLLNRKSTFLLRGERKFPQHLVIKEPNFILLPSQELFRYAIFLYSLSENLPMPYPYEVLVCEESTTSEELDIFWKRSLSDHHRNYYHIYCLIHVEKLTFETSKAAHQSLSKYLVEIKTHSKYKLVILCSEEQEQNCYMASALDKFKRIAIDYNPSEDVSAYLLKKLRINTVDALPRLVDPDHMASRLVISDTFGAGKSLYIGCMKSKLDSIKKIETKSFSISLYGNRISQDSVLSQLVDTRNWNSCQMNFYHIDIASTIQHGIESLLFKLIVLGCTTNSDGVIWARKSSDFYAFEITVNLLQPSIRQLIQQFPYFHCLQPNGILNQQKCLNPCFVGFNESMLSNTEYQRVFSYLSQFDSKTDLDSFVYTPDLDSTDYALIVQVIIRQCGIRDPSWTEISYFVKFLNKQLADCEKSSFCQMAAMGKEWRGFKSFVLRLMIHMSRDFATPSLERPADSEGPRYEIIERRKWENSSHPYIFFNPDGHTMTFLGFCVDGRTTNLLNSDDTSIVIEERIMPRNLLIHLQDNRVDLNENFQKLSKKEIILKLTRAMGCEHDSDPDPNYVITLDNARKILGIHMRFRCNIPVLIMGETGCGKTYLIEYMCALQAYDKTKNNLLIMKMHGGTTQSEIINTVERAQIIAKNNKEKFDIDTVVFFDEANTSSNISFVKGIMCDHRLGGKPISRENRLQFIAACNPYRRHKKEMITKLNQAGLGYFKNKLETSDRIGNTPLRELVYRVMDLPESLGSLVWDFGRLNAPSERKYILEIVTKYLNSVEGIEDRKFVIADILCTAQNHMRDREDECSYVSLRDVVRTMQVLLWFYRNLKILNPSASLMPSESSDTMRYSSIDDSIHDMSDVGSWSSSLTEEESFEEFDILTSSVILALSVCYRSRLQEREAFDVEISACFLPPLKRITKCKYISREVEKYYKLLFADMTVGQNIAGNHSLKENIFMMFICTELKIPLFIVGKPGSSKSLSKSIISDSMQGARSIDGSILKNFKQVHMISYQCSQLSTSEGIIDVFNKCSAFQKGRNPAEFVSCVVLDEVGLAEDSPKLPLKVLHPLLDDSLYIHQNIIQNDINKEISIENVEEGNELQINLRSEEDRVGFIGISNWALDPAKMNRGIMLIRGEPTKEDLISSAKGIMKKGESRFFKEDFINRIHNLADSYMCLINEVRQSDDISKDFYGLRDFYSLIKMIVFLCKHYQTKLSQKILRHSVLRNFSGIGDIDPFNFFDIDKIVYPTEENKGPEDDTLSLIQANLDNYKHEKTFYSENRYLLLLTENLAALDIVLSSPNIWPKDAEQNHRILFGSSFPDDQEYSMICRNINKIKLYMETGKIVILINLDNLYESLYDALNQYYMHIYGHRYIDLGLGTHRVKCRVHDDFKLIIIADKQTVFHNFPPPLINRLEKHTLLISTILPDQGRHLVGLLTQWALAFSTPIDKSLRRMSEIQIGDCFIGYHSDTPAHIIYAVAKQMNDDFSEEDLILTHSKTLLLKLASVDSVFRLKYTNLEEYAPSIIQEYFEKTCTTTLEGYLFKILNECIFNDIYLLQATTHSRLMNENDSIVMKASLRAIISFLNLQQFRTKQEFDKEFINHLHLSQPESVHIIVIQSENGDLYKDLISSVRYAALEMVNGWLEVTQYKVVIIFLVQLPRKANGSDFFCFHGRSVNSIHVDDILEKNDILPPLQELNEMPFHSIFSSNGKMVNRKLLLVNCIQLAVSCLEDCCGSEIRSTSRIKDITSIFKNEKHLKILFEFYNRISGIMKEIPEARPGDWIVNAATCWDLIQSSGSFNKCLVFYVIKQVTPIFAELLALLDRNGNLALHKNQDNYSEKLNLFWELLFLKEELFSFSIDSYFHSSKRVRVQSDGSGGKFFQSQFPFSWLIFNTISELMYSARTTQVSDLEIKRLQILFQSSPIGALVDEILMQDENSKDYMYKYLNDFIEMSFSYSQNEYKENEYMVYRTILIWYIDLLNENAQNLASLDLVEDSQRVIGIRISIPLIHQSHFELKDVLTYIEEFFSFYPKFSRRLVNKIIKIRDDPDECKILYRVEHLLLEEIVTHCKFDDKNVFNPAQAKEYCRLVSSFNEFFSKGLHIDRTNVIKDYDKHRNLLRSQWNSILVIFLFISKVRIPVGLDITKKSHNALELIFDENTDFTDVEPMQNLINILDSLHRTAIKDGNFNDQKRLLLQHCITDFLSNLISSIIVKHELQNNLLEYLSEYITFDLNEFIQTDQDIAVAKQRFIPPPSLKMLILHILLRTRQRHVMECISRYLENFHSKVTICRDPQVHQHHEDLYLMIIYSIEDSYLFSTEEMSKEERVIFTSSMLEKLDENSLCQEKLLDRLQSVAMFRFLSLFMSGFIRFGSLTESRIHDIFLHYKALIELDCHETIHDFFYRAVYQRIGFALHILCETNAEFSWIIPDYKRISNQKFSPDVFSIYGDHYESCHRYLSDNITSQISSEDRSMEMPKDSLEFLIFSHFDLSINSTINLSQNINEQINRPDFMEYMMRNCYLLSFGCLQERSSLDIAILRLLWHLTFILRSQRHPGIFKQISCIFGNPEALEKTYFPTMEDSGSEFARSILNMRGNATGNWYSCKNGHIYLIGDCGRAWDQSKCPECGEIIGGATMHVLYEGNTKISQKILGTGYLLKDSTDVNSLHLHKRAIPPIGVVIIQILIHSTFLIASKLNDPNSLDCLLTTTDIGASTLEEFFTQRLSKDINNLKILTQKNCDEAILCIHIILKNFLNSPDQIKSSFSLIRRPDDRELWEKDFYEKIIFPALKENDSSAINLYQHFNTPRSISSLSSQSDGSDFTSKFWMNRSLIGLNHFKSVFLSQSPAEQNNYPILNKFVNEEFILSVTQHLPDIIRLQAMLFKDFGFRIDKAYAKNNSIEQILIRIPSDQKSVLDEYNRCLTSLFKALKQIGKAVLTQWRLPLPNEDISDLAFNTKLIYFLPTSMKESKLVSSLIDILVCSHNSLVHEFEAKNKGFKAKKLSVLNIRNNHLINFQDSFHSLLLSQINYQLPLSQDNSVTYDFNKIEEEFAERYLRMSPLLIYERSLFEFKREAYDPIVFQKVKEKVQQENIGADSHKQIIDSLESIDVISEILLLVDVIIGFVSSAGGDPNCNLLTYITDILCYDVTNLAKIKEIASVICLKHLLNFWNVLSFEKAKEMALKRQDPFGYLDDLFFQPLEPSVVQEISKGINKYHVETLLHQLHDFIQFKMRTMENEMLEFSLRDCIQIYTEDKDIVLPTGFMDFFPETPKISQTIAVWTLFTAYESESKK